MFVEVSWEFINLHFPRMSFKAQKVASLKILSSQRWINTLATKVKPKSSTEEKFVTRVPWKHKLATKNLMSRYFDVAKVHPALIYDFTDDLQLVKPYTVNIKTHLTKDVKEMKLYDYKMLTTTGPIPKSHKSQHVTQLLESKGVILDKNVYRTGSSPLSRHKFIITNHHRHEKPIPRFDPAHIKPIKINDSYSYVDKPAGIPCIPSINSYAYNSLQFMLYVHKHIRNDKCYFHNDLGFAPGVVIICRNIKQAYKLAEVQAAGNLEFVYLIHVYRKFDPSLKELMLQNSRNPKDCVQIDRLQYDSDSHSSLLRLKCRRHDLRDIQDKLSELSHPVVNDWKAIKVHGGHINNSLSVEMGNESKDLFKGKRNIHDAAHNDCDIMNNPVGKNQRSKEDYVIKSRDLNLSPSLERYYNQYRRVLSSHEHIKFCAECSVTRLPLPVDLMSPHIHLVSIEGGGLSCHSKQTLPWI